jgi:hypothetical protein
MTAFITVMPVVFIMAFHDCEVHYCFDDYDAWMSVVSTMATVTAMSLLSMMALMTVLSVVSMMALMTVLSVVSLVALISCNVHWALKTVMP